MPLKIAGITAIIFDLDGTLIDSSVAVVEAFNGALGRKGYAAAPADAICAAIGNPLPVMFAPHVPAGQDLNEMVALYRECYSPIYLEKTRLIDGVAEALAGLSRAGFALGIATTKPRYFTEPILTHLGVRGYFSAIVGAEDVKNLKPAPDTLIRAMEILGRNSGETIFVGDTPLDIGAARAAGVPVACVLTGHTPPEFIRQSRPDAVFDDLPAFVKWILSQRRRGDS